MTHKWSEIRRNQSPEREARLRARIEREAARLPLAELRNARMMTQTRMAELLKVNQGAISKLEKRSDMYLSTLRSYLEAMGGSLEIRAVFQDGEVMIEGLSEERSGPRTSGQPRKTAGKPKDTDGWRGSRRSICA